MKRKLLAVFTSILLTNFSMLNPATAFSLPGLNMVVRGDINLIGTIPPYSNDQIFSGLCLAGGTVDNIDFNWGNGGPCNGIIDYFTTYFYGYLKAPITGKIYFFDQSDDGFYMTLDDEKVISDWELQGVQSPNGSGNIDLVKDHIYSIKVWNYENQGGAAANLFWNTSNDFSGASIVPKACFSTDGTVWSGTCSLFAPPPIINSITSTIGSTSGGTSTTIFGSNLSGVKNVKFGGVDATLGANTATSISVNTPSNSAGIKDVSVTTEGGTATKVAAFTYCDYKGYSSNAMNSVGSNKSSSLALTRSQGLGACQNAASR